MPDSLSSAGVETVILIPALASTARMWRPQLDALSGTHRAVVCELPGHGGVPGPFTLAAAAQRAAAAVDDAVGPVVLCGISLGATVAVLGCLERPGRVSRLVLSGGIAHPPAALAVQRAIAAVLPIGVMARIAADGEDMRAVGRRTYLDGLRELARVDLRPRLGEITAATTVVCGARDKVNVPLSRELAAGIPGAQLRIIPGAGHLWNLEQPEAFTALLL